MIHYAPDPIFLQQALNDRGYAVLPGLLSEPDCEQMRNLYADETLYRSTIKMERYRFGRGEYKYFKYPLPRMIHGIREQLYPALSTAANAWMQALNISTRFPDKHDAFIAQCHNAHQTRPTPLILKYEAGGYNTLHQDLYGDVYFPFQVVVLLSKPNEEFTGGEFVMTEQVPRAQSRAQVVHLKQGDALVFTTNFKPCRGTRGYYRTTMKHGVSEVTSGTRYAMGIIFHDAQ
jgi:hypothetical protein